MLNPQLGTTGKCHFPNSRHAAPTSAQSGIMHETHQPDSVTALGNLPQQRRLVWRCEQGSVIGQLCRVPTDSEFADIGQSVICIFVTTRTAHQLSSESGSPHLPVMPFTVRCSCHIPKSAAARNSRKLTTSVNSDQTI